VEVFLNGMERLGEPFLFGLDDPVTYFEALGYATQTIAPCWFYGGSHRNDPVFAHYSFLILEARGRPDGLTAPRTFKSLGFWDSIRLSDRFEASVRLWQLDERGQWQLVNLKGVSVRLDTVAGVVDVLSARVSHY
jgi:hypothetical protein